MSAETKPERDPLDGLVRGDKISGTFNGFAEQHHTIAHELRGTGRFIGYRIRGRGNKVFSSQFDLWKRAWAAGATVIRTAEDKEGE